MAQRLGPIMGGIGQGLSGVSDAFLGLAKKEEGDKAAAAARLQGQQAETLRQVTDHVARGEVTPEQGVAALAAQGIQVPTGHFDQVQQPVSTRLASIMSGIDKASSLQDVPTEASLGASVKAQRLPVRFGAMSQSTPTSTATSGNLPSTALGPTSPEFDTLKQAREQKFAQFPPVKQSVMADNGMTTDRYVSPDPRTLTGQSFQTGLSAAQKATNELQAWNLNEGSPARAAQEAANKLQQFKINEGSPERTAIDVTNKNTLEAGTRAQKVKTAAAETSARTNAEMNAEAARYGLTKAQISEAGKQADNFEQQSKNFFITQDAFRKMATAAPDKTRAGDLVVTYNFIKMLDPNVVRPSEIEMVAQTGSLKQRAWQAYDRLLADEGATLAPDVRQQIMRQASGMYQSDLAGHKDRVQTFSQRAAQLRIPPSLVLRQGSPQVGAEADMIRPAPGANAPANPLLDALRARKAK